MSAAVTAGGIVDDYSQAPSYTVIGDQERQHGVRVHDAASGAGIDTL